MTFWCPICNKHIKKSYHICKDLAIMKKSVFYENIDKLIKCDYVNCIAGMGVAGRHKCILGGDLMDLDCKNFISEE